MKTKNKLYCVHVFEHYHDYENISASSPSEAERKVMSAEYNNNYEDISHVEVMRQCDCGTDNDLSNKVCDNCGKKL